MHDAFRASVGEGYDEALLHSCMTLQCFFLLFFFFISPSNNASVLRKPPVPSVRMSRRTAAPLCPPVSVLLVLNWKTTWEVLFSSEAVLQNESFESFSFSSSHAQVKRASGSHWIPASFNVSTAVLPACYVHLLTNKHLTKHFFLSRSYFSSLCTGGWRVCQPVSQATSISSHIYSMHSSFSVLFSSLSFSQVVCFCVWMRASLTLHVRSSCFYLKSVSDVLLFLLLWRGHWSTHCIYRTYLCVFVWMRGFVLACVSVWFNVSFFFFSFFSNAAWRSLKLMGPPVASLLIFLHPSPLGCMLAARPRSPCELRTS